MLGLELDSEMLNLLRSLEDELSLEDKAKIDEGISVVFGDYKFTIVACTDGVIERILIENI